MPNKKSILFVNGHLNVGGVEKALVELLSWIDYEVYDVDLLLLQGRGDFEDRIPRTVRIIEYDTRQLEGPFFKVVFNNLVKGNFANVIYRCILLFSSKYGNKYLSFLRFILPSRNHYDAAIAFRPDHCAEIVANSIRSLKKFCWWHHGEINLNDDQIYYLDRLWQRFDKVVTVSEGCKRLLLDTFTIPPEKYFVLPNIIDTENINYMAGEESPYGNENRKKFVTLSRLSPEKHLQNAVLVAASLVKGGVNDFVWYIVGDGECEQELRQSILNKGLQDHLVMIGRKVNPYPYLKFADVYVHTSYIESLGIAVLEAMALRTPVIAVRSIGTSSYIEDRINGFIVERGVDALVEGINAVLNMDSNKLCSVIDSGSATIEHLCAPQIVMKSFECMVNE